MIPVFIGTYRMHMHIEACLESMHKHLKGFGDITFIDDSGDDEHSAWLSQFGKVIATGARGQRVAYTEMCRAADGQQAFVLEEDFTFLTDVDLAEMSETLYHRPYLAQLVLQRGPHFPVEHQYGGMIEALKAKGHKFTEVNGVIEHTACFSANPSLWRGETFTHGWPRAMWAEERKGDELVRLGFRFGYLPGIRVEHHGERTGHGY